MLVAEQPANSCAVTLFAADVLDAFSVASLVPVLKTNRSITSPIQTPLHY
jgi:hypothetical protein